MPDHYTPEQKQMIEQYSMNSSRRSMESYRKHRSLVLDAAAIIVALILLAGVLA